MLFKIKANGNGNEKEEKETVLTLRLTLPGWIMLFTCIIGVVMFFARSEAGLSNAKDEIKKLDERKLDKYNYTRDIEFERYRDSIIMCKINKIAKKLNIDD